MTAVSVETNEFLSRRFLIRSSSGDAEIFRVIRFGRKETVLDLAKFVDRGVSVKLSGGRQVTGILKGYDQLLNLVLDEATENLRDSDDPMKTTDQIRQLGLIVCRGTAVMLVAPTDGTEEIPNPFLQNETPAAT
ncbi:sm-like protein LSM7 isoform X3 [Physcomitrium patens]|uniref:sm-like protein LSM7 isoform X3 n=1 Tax=Physcomitrium patens TaxID=3218 RepID=UPI003CCD1396